MQIHRILLPDGTSLSSGTESLPAIQGVSLTQKVNTQAMLCCGAVWSALLELTILCQGEKMPIQAGDKLVLFGDADAQIGVFYAQAPVQTGKGIYQITAYDSVSLLDKDLTQWLSQLTQWPYSLHQLAQLVCEQCDVQLKEQCLPNGDFLVEKFSGQGITGRHIISWIAEAAGRFCIADQAGVLSFDWYTPRDLTLAPHTDAFYYQGSLSHEDSPILPIDQVVIRQEQADVGTAYPPQEAGENVYIVEGNPLLAAQNGQSLLGIAQSLYTQLSSVSYTPCQVRVPRSTNVCPGEIIQIQGRGDNLITAYVMERKRTGKTDTLQCSGLHRRSDGAVSAAYSYQALSGKVLRLQRDVDGLQVENKNAAGSLSQLALDLDGIRTQVKTQQETADGVKSQLTSLNQTNRDLQIRIQSIQENGTQKVTTATGYTFDDNGLHITKSGEEMENKLDNTGMYVKRSGQVILQANNQGVKARDVEVSNFLKVGSHARFETYFDGTDSRRTACFWIGG